jgi:hypothetical protein
MFRNFLTHGGAFAAGMYVQSKSDEDFTIFLDKKISTLLQRVSSEEHDFSADYREAKSTVAQLMGRFKNPVEPTMSLRGDKAIIKGTSALTEIVITETAKNKKIEIVEIQGKKGVLGLMSQRNVLFQASVPAGAVVEYPLDAKVSFRK